MERLEREFLENGGVWKDVAISEIFYLSSSRKIYHANQIQIYDEQIQNSYPYIVRSAVNNGIKGYIIQDERTLNMNNTITFAQDTFTAFYQKQKYYTGNKVKVLQSKFSDFNEKSGLFIASAINKVISKSTWGEGSTEGSINSIKIALPFLDGSINFSYMEKFIEELEAERIEELEAYLMATGLKDYKLTKEEEKMLNDFEKMSDNSLDRQTDRQD